jgi:general secretion pathway protein A
MYLSYFGLSEPPFSIAPNPRYLYMSARHKEALAHLLYSLGGSGGIVLLTGEIGAGKTTLARRFLEQIPDNCRVAYVLNPKLTALELLSTICDEFHITYARSNATIKTLVDAINCYLLEQHAQGRNCLLVVDEAQNLSPEVLEQLRLLTNLETHERKLLQITLIGQPELRSLLARPDLRQVEQRVIARYHLDALSAEDTAHYLAHRLMIAGGQATLFNRGAAAAIHAWTHGVPRRINVLADRALLGAYAQNKRFVDEALVHQAAEEVFDAKSSPRTALRRKALWAAAAAGVSAAAVIALLAWWNGYPAKYHAARGNDPTANDQIPRTVSGDASRTPPAVPASAAQAGTVVRAVAADTLGAAAPSGADAAMPQRLFAARGGEAAAASIDWSALGSADDGRGAAWRAVYQAWKLPEPADGDGCRAAAAHGLACIDGSTGLDMLARYNRPAVLKLQHDGRSVHAALLGIDAAGVRLRIGDGTQRVARQALAASWSGGYSLLWRAPPGRQALLQRGQRGPAVAQLAEQLKLAQALPADAPLPDGFDDGLQRAVRAFQVVHGLEPDGIAGPQTLLVLAGLTQRDAPTIAAQER